MKKAAIKRVDAHGRAEGAPRSLERQKQVAKLWKLNYPALHLHIGRDNEGEWRVWASKMRHIGMQRNHPLRNALHQYAPEGAQDDN